MDLGTLEVLASFPSIQAAGRYCNIVLSLGKYKCLQSTFERGWGHRGHSTLMF
jgi:hypothetical protein